jgi:hypothetical protein
MSLRARVETAIRGHDTEALEALVAEDARVLRHLASMTYDSDAGVRAAAAHAIARAAGHHPGQVSELVRRLVWAMNDESGTNSRTAPEVIWAIALEQPELLLPMLPDLARLTADEQLRPLLLSAVRAVAERYPSRAWLCPHREPSDRAALRDGERPQQGGSSTTKSDS